MKPKTLRRIRYTVRGTGSFPADMLRYDVSFPATPEDVQWIALANNPRHRAPVELMLETYLSTAHRDRCRPTEGRWNSFGWSVTEVYPTERVPYEQVPEERRPQ